jgi:hypothetical protein
VRRSGVGVAAAKDHRAAGCIHVRLTASHFLFLAEHRPRHPTRPAPSHRPRAFPARDPNPPPTCCSARSVAVDGPVPSNGHFLAMWYRPMESCNFPRCAPDFHFARRDSSGTWSHKLGEAPASDADSDGKKMRDPEVGCFMYRPGGSGLAWGPPPAAACLSSRHHSQELTCWLGHSQHDAAPRCGPQWHSE